MATGLQYKENLTMYSTGYPGEGVGSNGVVQNWTDLNVLSGSTTATYYYHDSIQASDSNSTIVNVLITDNWSATIDRVTNTIRITVSTTVGAITRTKIGSPGALKARLMIRRYRNGNNLWSAPSPLTSTNYVDAAINDSYAAPGDIGTTTLVLPPGQENAFSSVFFRSEIYPEGVGVVTPPSSQWVDEFGMGVNFRNVLPLPTTYSLVYDANGGSGAPLAQTTTTGEGSATFTVSNGTPTWGSFRFLGWSNSPVSGSGTMADVDYEAGDTITLQEGSPNKTIYAVWEKDYRPGKIIDNNGIWQSHNRSTGADNIRTGSNWQTMRTIDGAVGTDNPPYMMHPSEFKNQRKIGNNA